MGAGLEMEWVGGAWFGGGGGEAAVEEGVDVFSGDEGWHFEVSFCLVS